MSVLYGCKRIAEYMSRETSNPMTRRQAEYMIQQGRIPAFKMGRIICATTEAIDEHFANLGRNFVNCCANVSNDDAD